MPDAADRVTAPALETNCLSMALTKRDFLTLAGGGAVAALTAGLLVLNQPQVETLLGRETLSVVATTGMIADAARAIGGARVEVRGLMGSGVDPHAYRQTRTDIVALANADLVLWHGLYLEAQMEEFLLDLGARRRVVAVAEALPKDRLRGHDLYPDRFDPHIWLDPALWATAIAAVRDALIAAAPPHRAEFEANAAAYLHKVEAVGAYAAQVLATVPPENRVLVTAHDAFGYFGQRYGFEVVGIQGISTQSEAGLARIGEVVDLLVARQIGAVFVESSVSERNMRALIEGAAARGHQMRVGGELFSDAMGQDGSYEGSYPGMIDHNATVIAAALGGTPPAGGMAARLGAGT